MSLQDTMKKFDETKFAKGGGSCFECCDYEDMYLDVKDFISQSIKTALKNVVMLEERKEDKGWNDCRKHLLKNIEEYLTK